MKRHKITLISIILCAVFMIASACAALGAFAQSEPTPFATTGNPVSFVQVEGGLRHTIALTADGEIYSWGTGTATGNGGGTVPKLVEVEQSTPLESGEFFVKLAASLNASAAITNKGRLFVWGSGSDNANGSSPVISKSKFAVSDINKPTHLDMPYGQAADMKAVAFTDIAAGDNHMIALATPAGSDKNVLYGWGDNKYSQTGRDFTPSPAPNPETNEIAWELAESGYANDRPLPLALGANPSMVAVFAGGDSSAIVLDTGAVFTFGRNKYVMGGSTGYALGYTTGVSQATSDFVKLKNSPASGTSAGDLDNPTQVTEVTNVSLERPKWSGGANSAKRPRELAASGFYNSVFSMGTFGTFVSPGTVSYFGFNYDGAFSPSGAGNSGNGSVASSGTAGITAIAAPRISSIETNRDYIVAGINVSSGKVYLWGDGISTVGGNEKLTEATFNTPYNFISSSIKFKAVFAGYNCIYVLDDGGKIYVMGKNEGNKLCNEPNTERVMPYPIEIDKTITKKASSEITADGYNAAKDAFEGKTAPITGDGYSNTLIITPADLLSNTEALDVIQFLGYTNKGVAKYPLLYGSEIYDTTVQVKIAMGTQNLDIDNEYIKVEVQYVDEVVPSTRLVITFKKKTPQPTDKITVTFVVGKFANKFDVGEDTSTLQRTQSFSISVYSLNSAPDEIVRPKDTIDFANMNPNNALGGGKTSREQTRLISEFFSDVDGDTVGFASQNPVEIIGDESAYSPQDRPELIIGKYIDIEILNERSFKVIAKQSLVSEIKVGLRVTDGDTFNELFATGTITITVVAAPTDEVQDIADVTPEVFNQAQGRVYYTVSLISGQSFKLNIADMFTDAASFEFEVPKRMDKDGVLGDVSADLYIKDVIKEPIVRSAADGKNNRVLTFNSQNAGFVDYVVRIKNADNSLFYIFRFYVTAIEAPKVNVGMVYNIADSETCDVSDLFVYAKDTLVVSHLTYNSTYAEVVWAVNSPTFTVQPKQNGEFTVYIVVTDSSDTSIVAYGEIVFRIADFYETDTVIVTAGGATCQLEWFVNIINNSLINSGVAVDKVNLQEYSFLTVAQDGEHFIPIENNELGISVRRINSDGREMIRFELVDTPKVTAGRIVVEIKKANRAETFKINVPVKIDGIFSWQFNHDVAEYKLVNKSATKSFTPIEIAAFIGKTGTNISIEQLKNNNPTKYIVVEKDKDTGELIIRPRANGVYRFDLVLSVNSEFCFVSVEFEISNLIDLPTHANYTQLFKIAIWVAFGIIILLLAIRMVRYYRRKRIYAREYEKYKMLTKIKKHTADPNHADKEAIVRAKLKMLDPKYAKAYGDARKEATKETAEDRIETKRKRIENLRNKLDGIEVEEETKPEKAAKEKATKEKVTKEKPVKEKPVKEKVTKEKPVKEKATKEKAAKETEEREEENIETRQLPAPATMSEQEAPEAPVQATGELSERDLLEEKIKARLAEEQAEAEAKAAAEKAEEEKFKSMTKEERKRAEMLKKLKAKYNKK